MQEVTDWTSSPAGAPNDFTVNQGETVILTPTGTVATAVFVNTVSVGKTGNIL